MPKTLPALALFLVAVLPCSAQIVGPTEVTVRKGEKNVSIEVSVTADSAEYLALGNLEMIREFTRSTSKLVIRVLTADAGEGYVVVAAVKGGEMLPLYKCLVRVIGNGPGPAPVPPKPPDPGPSPVPPIPVPVDPLVKAILDAATNDGMPKEDLSKVAEAAKNASMLTLKGQTAQRAHDLVKVSLSKSPPLGISLHTILDDMTGKVFAGLLTNPTEVLDETNAEAIRAPFVRLAKALEEAAK